jgi:hypothetical protein
MGFVVLARRNFIEEYFKDWKEVRQQGGVSLELRLQFLAEIGFMAVARSNIID